MKSKTLTNAISKPFNIKTNTKSIKYLGPAEKARNVKESTFFKFSVANLIGSNF